MLILTLLAISPLLVKLILGLEQQNDLNALRESKKYDKRFLIVCGILITFVMGFRGVLSGSPDTDAYSKFFMALGKQDNLWEYLDRQIADKIWIFSEVGFNLFMWLLSRISTDPQLLILTTSAFVVFNVMRFIYKNSTNVMLSVILFLCLGLFTFSMNGMRQAMAMSICLWAYEFVKENKLWKFILVVFLATLFHKTSIVFFVVYFIKDLKYDTKSILIFLSILLIFVILTPTIVKYLDEIYDKNYSESESRESGGLVQVLIYGIVLTLSLIFNKSLKDDQGKNYFYLILLACFFFLLRFISSQIFERISYYFAYFLLLFVPKIIKECEQEDQSTMMSIFILMSILLFVYRLNSSFSNFYLCFQ